MALVKDNKELSVSQLASEAKRRSENDLSAGEEISLREAA